MFFNKYLCTFSSPQLMPHVPAACHKVQRFATISRVILVSSVGTLLRDPQEYSDKLLNQILELERFMVMAYDRHEELISANCNDEGKYEALKVLCEPRFVKFEERAAVARGMLKAAPKPKGKAKGKATAGPPAAATAGTPPAPAKT